MLEIDRKILVADENVLDAKHAKQEAFKDGAADGSMSRILLTLMSSTFAHELPTNTSGAVLAGVWFGIPAALTLLKSASDFGKGLRYAETERLAREERDSLRDFRRFNQEYQ